MTILCLEERFVSQRYIPIASVCLIVYSAILIIREAFQLVLFRKEHLTSPVNYIEVLLFIFTIMFASVHSNQCYCTHPWQWQVGVVAVFLSWIALVFSIRKLPVVGIYVVMFIKIFNNFVKVVVLALLLILAFAVPFYMMFYDPQNRAEGIVRLKIANMIIISISFLSLLLFSCSVLHLSLHGGQLLRQ